MCVLQQTCGDSGGVDFLAEAFLAKPHLVRSSFHRALIGVLCQIGEALMTESAKTHRMILGDGRQWKQGKEAHGWVHEWGGVAAPVRMERGKESDI